MDTEKDFTLCIETYVGLQVKQIIKKWRVRTWFNISVKKKIPLGVQEIVTGAVPLKGIL